MKILLIKPPLNPNLVTTSLYEPLELEYLAASVPEHDVRILDMRIDKNLSKHLYEFRPELVGITSYTCDYNVVIELLKKIRKFDSKIVTIVGGNHATFLPHDFNIPEIDAIFLGYADSAFPQFIRSFNSTSDIKRIPNIGLVQNSTIFFTQKENVRQELDTLPYPARELTAQYRKYYHDPVRNKMALVMTSRGCPFKCSFCACWKLMHGKCVTRTPESIVSELKQLHDSIKVVYFSDDNTFINIERMWKLSELIKQNQLKKQLQMYARADTIIKYPELFRELKTAGLQFLTVGLESFKDNDLDDYNKKTTVDVNNKAIRILKELNIHVLAHFIVRPEYSRDDFRKLYNYVHENNLFRPAYPVLTPLPGTSFFDNNRTNFAVTNFDFFDFAHSILPTKLESKEFYWNLAQLYSKSYSVSRYLTHRFNRLLSTNKTLYFTDNMDGMNFIKILLTGLFAYRGLNKIKNSYQNNWINAKLNSL